MAYEAQSPAYLEKDKFPKSGIGRLLALRTTPDRQSKDRSGASIKRPVSDTPVRCKADAGNYKMNSSKGYKADSQSSNLNVSFQSLEIIQ
jgi:hypothetical protein